MNPSPTFRLSGFSIFTPTSRLSAQKVGDQPCGDSTAAKRVVGLVAAASATAGIIDSRNGSANVTPAPRRNVRRGMYFRVMNIFYLLLSSDPIPLHKLIYLRATVSAGFIFI